MVVENFRADNSGSVGERFQLLGRMLPDRVSYHASWMDLAGTRCSSDGGARSRIDDRSVSRWNDLVEFEIVPVETSSDFWSKFRA